MSITSSDRIYENPQTEAHVRQNWARIQNQNDDVQDQLDDHEERLDILDGGPQTAVFDATTDAGSPVYVSSNGHVDRGDADAVGTSNIVGVAREDTASAATGEYIRTGYITLASWTAVAGAATLTPGARYFLSATVGMITTTAPSSAGQVVVVIGTAVTTLKLQLEIEQGILL